VPGQMVENVFKLRYLIVAQKLGQFKLQVSDLCLDKPTR